MSTPAQLGFDGADLENLTNTLRHAADTMRQATGAMESASAQDLGSHGIDNAAEGFQDRWHSGIDKISKAATSMVQRMQAAQSAYLATEQQNAQLQGGGVSIENAPLGSASDPFTPIGEHDVATPATPRQAPGGLLNLGSPTPGAPAVNARA